MPVQVFVQIVEWPKFLHRQDVQLLSTVHACKYAVVPGIAQVPSLESGIGLASFPQDDSRTAANKAIMRAKREATTR